MYLLTETPNQLPTTTYEKSFNKVDESNRLENQNLKLILDDDNDEEIDITFDFPTNKALGNDLIGMKKIPDYISDTWNHLLARGMKPTGKSSTRLQRSEGKGGNRSRFARSTRQSLYRVMRSEDDSGYPLSMLQSVGLGFGRMMRSEDKAGYLSRPARSSALKDFTRLMRSADKAGYLARPARSEGNNYTRVTRPDNNFSRLMRYENTAGYLSRLAKLRHSLIRRI